MSPMRHSGFLGRLGSPSLGSNGLSGKPGDASRSEGFAAPLNIFLFQDLDWVPQV